MTTLWDVPPPARRGHRTQQAGAAAIAAKAPCLRERVLAFIMAQGADGATNEEISDALAMTIQSVCGRMGELKALDQVRDKGVTRKNKSSGVQAIVWVAYVEGIA